MLSINQSAKSFLGLSKTFAIFFFGFMLSASALADSASQARRLHQRLTGVPASKVVLDQMVTLIDQGKEKEAAKLAIQNSNFLNLTIFDMFAPMTNEDENNRVVLSDFLATILGVVRDDLSFKEVLTGDVIYTAPDGSTAAWSPNNNDMYTEHQAANPIDFSTSLVKKTQSEILKPVMGLDNTYTDFAGVFSTREFAVQYYFDGTNRAALNYGFKSFLCRDIEKLSDSSRADHMVRQDVERNPGNNSTVYRNQCVGCHAGMDALGGAFAYFDATDVEGELQYAITPGVVHAKYSQNSSNYIDGHETKDNSWVNLWAEGSNKVLDWKGTQSGSGIKGLGELMVNSGAFPKCMARRAFSRVCVSKWETEEGPHIDELAQKFIASGYNMKDLFAEASIQCMGE